MRLDPHKSRNCFIRAMRCPVSLAPSLARGSQSKGTATPLHQTAKTSRLMGDFPQNQLVRSITRIHGAVGKNRSMILAKAVGVTLASSRNLWILFRLDSSVAPVGRTVAIQGKLTVLSASIVRRNRVMNWQNGASSPILSRISLWIF